MTSADNTPVPDYLARLRLDGRRVVLLGAGQGIGRQAAHALSQAGAQVVCVDRERTLADEIAAEIGGIPWSGDATDAASMERLFDEAAAAMGGVDGVVDIIGMARYADLVDADDDEWAWHHDIVLRHAMYAVRFGGRKIVTAGGGTLTFVASVSGLSSAPRHGPYGAYKAALMSLVRTAAVELGPHGVRVNSVSPGVVWTPRVSGYLGDEGKARNVANAPLRKVALPADIASALLFLTSDLATYVSGQNLVVDGGVSAKFGYPMEGL